MAASSEGGRQAAVAILARGEGVARSVLLMRRAVRTGDRWSGQISLPGGHHEDADPTLAHTAVRETLEEVGVDLDACAHPLGNLDPVRAKARGVLLATRITPFVYRAVAPISFALGPEATEAFWFPLGRAETGAFDAMHRFQRGDQTLLLPCWEFEERRIWGLTYEMLSTYLKQVADGALP